MAETHDLRNLLCEMTAGQEPEFGKEFQEALYFYMKLWLEVKKHREAITNEDHSLDEDVLP